MRVVRVLGRGRSAPARPARTRHHYVWASLAVLLVVCGVLTTVLGAASVGRNRASESTKVFAHASAAVASSLQLSILHEADLTADVGGLLVANPALGQSEFTRWATAGRVLDRYPEMGGFASIVMVNAADLPAFAARSEADPAGPLGAGGKFSVLPPGARKFYCFPLTTLTRDPSTLARADSDFCANPTTTGPLLAARDSGVFAYLPYQALGHTWLGVQTPIYRGRAIPATVSARRAAFVGWVASVVDPTVLLNGALRNEPGMSAKAAYHGPSGGVVFGAGRAPVGATSATADLSRGWAVQTFGAVDGAGVGHGSALVVLIAGVAVSLLLGLLLFVLATGRERARRLVAQRTEELRHQTLHDALTGLPNRVLVLDRLEQLLLRDRRSDNTAAVLFIDLDDFKNVNDTLGHGAGDQLLVAVAGRLAGALRDADTIGRMGGDEFVILIDGASMDTAPELVAERLLEVMRQPFDLDGASAPLMVSISIGIATGDRAAAADLLRDADVALYQSKGAGKNRYETFEPDMQLKMNRRADLEFELRSALSGHQYRLVYQPIYNLDDLTVIGVEALLRWDHPTDGVIPPDEFIPLLEQTGQIREVGRWVLDTACAQMAHWHAQGDTMDVSVNVSGRQLDHDSIVDDIRHALRTSGLNAGSLIIEITETALMDNVSETARRLALVKDLGVRVAIDDFGTGYSSLAYLRQFPVDCLKIDRMFTRAITTSPESKALVGTLVQLGRDLGLRTLAEGVETAEEMDLLRSAHVNLAQGFLMARPLDPQALNDLMAPTRPIAEGTRL